MQKVVVIIIISLLMFSCKGNSTEGEAAGKTEKTETTAVEKSDFPATSVKMNKELFLTRVMNFEQNPSEWKYEGDLPCLIDFYADWCGPCKIAAPVLEELAAEYAGKIIIYKVDTEVERELAGAFGIRSIPSFLFCPQNGQPTMSSGIARSPEETKEMFRKMIDELLLEKGSSLQAS